ncbi:MAG: hypothetical protein ACM3NH_00435 [Candidatus Saccharibacteria bacterium]
MNYKDLDEKQKEAVDRRVKRMNEILSEQKRVTVRIADSGDKLEFHDRLGGRLFTAPLSEFVTPG